MEAYKQALEKAADKELSSAVFWGIVLLVVFGSLWVSQFIYFKKMKKHPKKYRSKKQVNIRRQSIGASIALTVIGIGLGAVMWWSAADTVSAIRKDIETNSYVTYTGGYYIATPRLYREWVSVSLDNGDDALIYRNTFFEAMTMESGHFEGKVVYGQNSLIIVEIEN